MVISNNKKRTKHLRKQARKTANLRLRDSKVGSACPQCNLLMTKSSPPGDDFSSVTIEHIVPIDPRYGGDSSPQNLEIICYSCNDGRNQFKKKNDNLDITLPALFWWSSINHSHQFYKRFLLDIYPLEWGQLKKFLSRMKEISCQNIKV